MPFAEPGAVALMSFDLLRPMLFSPDRIAGFVVVLTSVHHASLADNSSVGGTHPLLVWWIGLTSLRTVRGQVPGLCCIIVVTSNTFSSNCSDTYLTYLLVYYGCSSSSSSSSSRGSQRASSRRPHLNNTAYTVGHGGWYTTTWARVWRVPLRNMIRSDLQCDQILRTMGSATVENYRRAVPVLACSKYWSYQRHREIRSTEHERGGGGDGGGGDGRITQGSKSRGFWMMNVVSARWKWQGRRQRYMYLWVYLCHRRITKLNSSCEGLNHRNL